MYKRQIKGRYEDHHNVTYTDDALEACVKLTDRYISDRNFPDKAIDALDEAGAVSYTHLLLEHAKLGIVMGSLVSGILGYILLNLFLPKCMGSFFIKTDSTMRPTIITAITVVFILIPPFIY